MITFLHIVTVIVVLFLLAGSTTLGCFTIIVGKKATADGSVLVGHNEQNSGFRYMNLRRVERRSFADDAMVELHGGGRIKQVKETWAFLWSENPGLPFSDGYLNEWGVAVVSNGCRDRKEDLDDLARRGQLEQGGISYLLRRVVAERAKTAREGVRIAGELIEQVGYPSSRTYTIADSHEAWLLAVVRGKQWLARRVPDDGVVLMPNVFIFGEVDLNDTENVQASKHLISYAQERGWYNPEKDGPFHFRRVYAPPVEPDSRRSEAYHLVTGNLAPKLDGEGVPFAVKPAHQISVGDMMRLLRHHGEASLCTERTQEGGVFQLRAGMVPAIGCVYWRTSAEPCLSMFVPFYLGVESVPESYHQPGDIETQLTLKHHFDIPQDYFEANKNHTGWIFRTLQDEIHKDYEKRITVACAEWREKEDELLASQPTIEKNALDKWARNPSAARQYLAQYFLVNALYARDAAKKMLDAFSSEAAAPGG